MPGSESKTLSDDFLDRVTRSFRPEFIENVHDPTQLTDYLQCLETIDMEIVKAQQTQYGAIHAASVLFDRLIRRPDWLDDLKRALKEPGVGCGFLAEKLEKFELTIPARWDMCTFTDEFGKACFNGNCSDIELVDGRDANLLFEKVTVDQSAKVTTAKLSSENLEPEAKFEPMEVIHPETSKSLQSEPRKPEVNQPYDEPDASGVLPVQQEGIDVHQDETRPKSMHDAREAIRLKREELRLKMMEKLYSYIQNPEDVPVAIYYMEKINLQLDRIDRGSVIFSIYIGSLDALRTFEQLWRCGGLKKLLDKEMLDKDMLKELKAVAAKAGHPVDNIQSELKVFDTDIERCRSSLVKTDLGFRPMNFADSYLLSEKNKSTKRKLKEVALYATDRLPDELKSMLEDPFVSDRVTRFFELDSLTKKVKHGQEKDSASMPKSVAQYFAEWLNSELVTFLTELDSDTKHHLLTLAVYLVHAVEPGGTLVIPDDVLFENFRMKEMKKEFPTEPNLSGYWGDFVKLPSELLLDSSTLQTACKELKAKGIICRSKNSLNFLSYLVRDVFVTKVILCSSFKGSMKTITDSFEYVQTLIGLYEMESRLNVRDQAMAELQTCSFKSDELREIGIAGGNTLTIDTESSFYNTDLISYRPGTVEVTKEISDAGKLLERRFKANAKTKQSSIDISEVVGEPFSVEAGLHWLNATKRIHYERESIADIGKVGKHYGYTRGLSISNNTITSKKLGTIGKYLNVTPSVSSMNLRNCRLKSSLLRNVLQNGHFRNIRQLNISDDLFQGSNQPLGLIYIPLLERLEIQSCHLGDDGIKVLALDLQHMESLRELNVANNGITYRGLLALTKALGSNRWMTGLRIHKNFIGKEGSFILASWLESLILLEVLNISECGIGDGGSQVIASALVSRSLKKLSMRKNGLTHKGSSDFFRHFNRPPYLEHLDFSENALFAASEITTLAVAVDLSPAASEEPFLKFLQHPTPLSHLSLWNTSVGEKRLFQELCNFEEMTYLCLQENNISDDFARDVSECIKKSKCSHLQHFNLRQNRIGNLGAIDIAKALSGQMYLKEVLLDRNEIGDDGADHIVTSCISLPSIERIDLSCNNMSRSMSDVIVKDLENSTHKGVAVTQFVRNQSSFDENGFNIVRAGDKFQITT